MSAIERITADVDSTARAGHELRYRLGAGYIEPGDVVLDAACGVGYGVALLPKGIDYIGVDIEAVVEPDFEGLGHFINADLCDWSPPPFDVGLSFETLEHVVDPLVLVATLCQARRLVVCSVPIVPTVGSNPYHLHDFTMWDIPRLFAEHGWLLHQCLLQPGELSAIYVLTP